MMITNSITMDVSAPFRPALIRCAQQDCCTRQVAVALTEHGENWPIPAEASVSVSYYRPDGTGGCYDLLPSGEPAWEADGHVLRIILAPQVLEVPGILLLRITLTLAQQQLSVFPVLVQVAAGGMPQDDLRIDSEGLTLWDAAEGERYRVWVSSGDLLMEAMKDTAS